MPKFLETRLRAQAAKEGKKGRAADRYVYGAMNNMGAMHGNKETAKGRKMEEKHEADQEAPHRKRQREEIARYKGVSTTYDHARPKRQVVVRYKR